MLREAREFGADLELHPRRHEREALEQSLHVRVGNVDTFHPQTAGDFREFPRELRTHVADMVQLLVVVAEKSRIHVRPLTGRLGDGRRTGLEVEVGAQVETHG